MHQAQQLILGTNLSFDFPYVNFAVLLSCLKLTLQASKKIDLTANDGGSFHLIAKNKTLHSCKQKAVVAYK